MTDADTERATPAETSTNRDGRANRRRMAEALLNNRWAQLLEVAIVFAPVMMAVAALRLLSPDNPLIFMAVLWLANVMMLGLIWGGIRIRGERVRSVGVSMGRVGARDLLGAAWKSILISICAIIAFALGAMIMPSVVVDAEAADLDQFNYLQGNLPMLLLSLAGVYVVSSFGEEVVYRGFLFTRLEKMFGSTRAATLLAVGVSAVLFGLAHFQWGATGVVQTTCMGAVFGASFLLTNRILWPLVLAHAYMDTVLLLPLYFGVSN